MKICNNCKKEIPIVSNRKKNICLPCHKIYTRKHYLENKQYYIDKATRARKELIILVKAAKQKPCTDCGIQYPSYVMDFDHIEDKSFNLSKAYEHSKSKVLEEINKCEVVCANCHRERTQTRIKRNSLLV